MPGASRPANLAKSVNSRFRDPSLKRVGDKMIGGAGEGAQEL